MTENNRKLSNFMLTPRFQLKLTFYFVVVGVGIIAATVSAVYSKVVDVRTLMNTSTLTEFATQSQINGLMFDVAVITLIGFVFFAMAAFIFALIVSHRIAGPTLAILAFINEIKVGNYDYNRGLRPDDELTPIMDALSDLACALREKSTGSQTAQ
jgi:nitrogen fixation/metabolism regulation signal transduction histidine kinase